MASRGTVIPFRALLFVLVTVVAIPALIFTVVLLERYADSERTRATIALEESAKGIARAADTLFANAGEVLKVLGNSTRLFDGDLEGFGQQIRSVTAGTGHQFDLVSPDGKAPRKRAIPRRWESALQGQTGPASCGPRSEGGINGALCRAGRLAEVNGDLRC